MGIADTVHSSSVATHIQRPDGVDAPSRSTRGPVARTLGPAVVTEFTASNLEGRRAIRGTNRTFDLLEAADSAAETATDGLDRLTELLGHIGNEGMPERLRADAAEEFAEIMADLDELAFTTNAAGSPVADGSQRTGIVVEREEPLPVTDLRLENLGLDGIEPFQLFSPAGRVEAGNAIERARGEIAEQRAEIRAAAEETAEAPDPELADAIRARITEPGAGGLAERAHSIAHDAVRRILA